MADNLPNDPRPAAPHQPGRRAQARPRDAARRGAFRRGEAGPWDAVRRAGTAGVERRGGATSTRREAPALSTDRNRSAHARAASGRLAAGSRDRYREGPGMTRLLLLAYPRAWRQRYGEELSQLVDDIGLSPRVALDLVAAGMVERIRARQVGSSWRHQDVHRPCMASSTRRRCPGPGCPRVR